MRGTLGDRFKTALMGLLVLGAAAGWLYVIVSEHRQNDPMGIVRKHFVFYPEYSHGVWRERKCVNVGKEACREVTYTVPVKGCGPVTFDWSVFRGDDGDKTWSYNGPNPSFDESKYPLYAFVSDDSHFIDSPALGKALPDSCQLK
jgi:hypothetical protein